VGHSPSLYVSCTPISLNCKDVFLYTDVMESFNSSSPKFQLVNEASPGDTVYIWAVVEYSDGAYEDVTSEVTLTSLQVDKVTVDSDLKTLIVAQDCPLLCNEEVLQVTWNRCKQVTVTKKMTISKTASKSVTALLSHQLTITTK
jgi:hypothetical protein